MAGGPGGHEVERIAVKVVPDTSGFAEKLKAFLDKVERSNKVEIEVDLDAEKAKAELKKLAKNLKIKIQVEVDAKGVRAELDRIAKDLHAKLKVELDDLKARVELDELTRNRKVKIKADVDKGILSRIGSLFTTLAGVLAGAGKGVFSLLTGSLGGVSQAINGVTGGFSKMNAVMQAIGTIATAVFYGVLLSALAGVVVAAGAVAGALALAFAPAVFIAAGVAFALMAKKGGALAKSLKKNFAEVKKTAVSVVSGAVTPMMRALNAQIPQIKGWISSIKGPLKSAFTSASFYVSQFATGLEDFAGNALRGVADALKNPNLKPAVDGIKTLFGDLGQAIGDFFSTLANFGQGFGDTLDALGVQLPPVAKALAGLLGAFTAVSPDLITRMGTGITKILDAFSQPQTIRGISILAGLSFDTIIFSLQLVAGTLGLVASSWDLMKRAASDAVRFVKTLFHAFVGWWKNTLNSIKEEAVTAWNGIKTGVSAAAKGMASGVKSAANGIKSFMPNLFNGIAGSVSGAFSKMASAASSKLRSIASSASSAVGKIKSFFSGLGRFVSGIVSSIRSAVGTIVSLASKAKSAISKIPFLATIDYDYSDSPGDPPPFGPPRPPGAMAMGSFQGDLNAMQSSAAKLNRSSFGSFKTPKTVGSVKAGVAQKNYNFGDIIANTQTTPEAITTALTRLDALYGT